MVKNLRDEWDDSASHVIEGLHAEMLDNRKRNILKKVASRKIRVLVATLASCAAGLDFPDITMIFFLTIPASIEQFWQGLGRAGRKGQKAKILLYSSLDDNVKAMAESTHLYSTRILLRSFGISAPCRLMEILNYIDGSHLNTQCGHCDLCEMPSAWVLIDASGGVKTLLQATAAECEVEYHLARNNFNLDAIEAALELGAITVRHDETIRRRQLISVSSDDATQLRLLASSQTPVMIRHELKEHQQKRRRTHH